MKSLFPEISRAALNLVFPIYCQGCSVRLSYDNLDCLCAGCSKKIKLNTPPFCIRCGKKLYGPKDLLTVCPACLGKDYYFSSARQCCEYDGLIKELIHKFKYNKKTFLKGFLASILSEFARHNIDRGGIDAIAAVPLHHSSARKRGFNQSELLARGLAKDLGIGYLPGAAVKIRRTGEQVGLSRKERFLNIENAFSARCEIVRNKNVLLVDDVFTTGATADSCAKALMEAGASSVSVLTLARGI